MSNEKLTPFTFVSAINSKKDYNVIIEHEKEYNAFILNRALSFHADCIFFVNEMNKYGSILDRKMQFDFYYHGLRKSSRFSKGKWKDEKTEMMKKSEVFQLLRDKYREWSTEKILKMMDLFSEAEVNKLKTEYSKGGK